MATKSGPTKIGSKEPFRLIQNRMGILVLALQANGARELGEELDLIGAVTHSKGEQFSESTLRAGWVPIVLHGFQVGQYRRREEHHRLPVPLRSPEP